MGAFYVSIIFLGILLIIGSLFFIAMDKVNGKDFFKEFDRKKEEMFNLIQDSEDMIQELNKISDYVVTTISEKNQEYFDRVNLQQNNLIYQPRVRFTEAQSIQTTDNISDTQNAPYNDNADNNDNSNNAINAGKIHNSHKVVDARNIGNVINSDHKAISDLEQQTPNRQKGAERLAEVEKKSKPLRGDELHDKVQRAGETEVQEEREVQDTQAAQAVQKVQEAHSENLKVKRELNTQMSDITERMNETNQSRLVLNSKRREVLKMIEQGMSNDEIADRLKIGKGEIGLIRGLSK